MSARIREGCDCGCNDPVATDPLGMLEFLSNRFKHAGVSHAVAEVYAHDIDKILADMQPAPATEHKPTCYAYDSLSPIAHCTCGVDVLRATQAERVQSSGSIDTPEFRALVDAHVRFAVNGGMHLDKPEVWNNLVAHIDARRATASKAEAPAVACNAALRPAPAMPVDAGSAIQQPWEPLTRAGQVKKGDKLVFTIGDRAYKERAKLILNPGTDKEEVVYDIGRNFYFITSCVLNGWSNHKGVEVLAANTKQGTP